MLSAHSHLPPLSSLRLTSFAPAPVAILPTTTDRPWRSSSAGALAGALAVLAAVLGWRGGDLPAQIYRVGLFHRDGLTLWDSQWYGGHWTLNYSVVFPPIAGIIGIQATAAASAAVAAWAFDRLVVGHFGRSARVGSLVFALGTLVQVSVGQLPFLLGEAFAICACLAAGGRRWRLAVALGLATSLASPLAGAFLGLAALAWMAGLWPRHRVALACVGAAVVLPVAVLVVVFPGQGRFPFRAPDLLAGVALGVGAWFIVPTRERALRHGARLYVLALGATFLLPSPLGGNIARLGDCLAVPLAACVLWPRRRWLLAVVSVPLAFVQWLPAWGAIVTNGRDASTHEAYYQPLVAFLATHASPLGRVEIVPTRLHWESAYVAPFAPLARGWERQLDTADNPLFYDDEALSATSYHGWLLDNGVRFVAVPDAPLDYAAAAEARLVGRGLSYLRVAWHNAHWRVYEVAGSPGIVSGPATLVRLDGGQIDLNASAAGKISVRVRYSPRWSLTSGAGCVREADGGWTAVEANAAGPISLRLRLTGSQLGAC